MILTQFNLPESHAFTKMRTFTAMEVAASKRGGIGTNTAFLTPVMAGVGRLRLPIKIIWLTEGHLIQAIQMLSSQESNASPQKPGTTKTERIVQTHGENLTLCALRQTPTQISAIQSMQTMPNAYMLKTVKALLTASCF